MTVSDIVNEVLTAYSSLALSEEQVRRLVYQIIWNFERTHLFPENLKTEVVQTYYDTEHQCRIADTTGFIFVVSVKNYVLVNFLPSEPTVLQLASQEVYRELNLLKLLPYNTTLSRRNVQNLFNYVSDPTVQDCITNRAPYMAENRTDFSPIGDLLTLKLNYQCADADTELSPLMADTVEVFGYSRTVGEYSPTLEKFGDYILSESIRRAGFVVGDQRGSGGGEIGGGGGEEPPPD